MVKELLGSNLNDTAKTLILLLALLGSNTAWFKQSENVKEEKSSEVQMYVEVITTLTKECKQW